MADDFKIIQKEEGQNPGRNASAFREGEVGRRQTEGD